MGKFEKGQYVRVLHTDYQEEFPVGSVFEVGASYVHGIEPEGEHSDLFFCNEEVEPWQPKVGDRVRMVKSVDGHIADCGATVVFDDGSQYQPFAIKFDKAQSWGHTAQANAPEGYGYWVSAADLEPIVEPAAPVVAQAQPAALKIEAGKFYKTRDGRKVGPMFYEGDYWNAGSGANGTPGHFTRYGVSAFEGRLPRDESRAEHDLIAEWIEEPVSTAKPKIGDKVRALADLIDVTKGNLYTVGYVDDEYNCIRITDDVGDRHDLDEDEYEVVTTPAAAANNDNSAPAKLQFSFKVGDKAKTRDGRVVTITHVDQDEMYPFVHDMGDGRYHGFDAGGKSCINCDEDDIVEKISEPAATNPKFKVGDRVRALVGWLDVKMGEVYTITEVDEEGARLLFDEDGQPWNYMDNDEIELVPPTIPAVVALIENGTAKPATRPKVHPDQASATTEAERLALQFPGQQFGVFVLADSKIADVVNVPTAVLRAA